MNANGRIQNLSTKKAVSILQKERLTKDVRYQEFTEIALGKRSGQAIYQGLFLFAFCRRMGGFLLLPPPVCGNHKKTG